MSDPEPTATPPLTPAGPELDALVAERVMGLPCAHVFARLSLGVVKCKRCDYETDWMPGIHTDGRPWAEPCSSSFRVAVKVWRKCQELGWAIRLLPWEGGWACIMTQEGRETVSGCGASEGEAISRCALAAVAQGGNG